MNIANENGRESAIERTIQKKTFCGKIRKWLSLKNPRKWKRKLGSCPWKKIPHFIIFISALQVVVYYTAGDTLKRIFPYRCDRKTELWRFVTYMLLHTNAVHLGLNVFIQGLFGALLEAEQGRLRCSAVYFGGGLAGSLGASAFASFSSMVGGSAGVYALLTSQIPNIVLNFETIKYPGYRMVTVAVLMASDVGYIFYHVYFNNNEEPHIGWVAHASGAVAGVLLGFFLFSKNLTSCLILTFTSSSALPPIFLYSWAVI